VPLDQAQLGQWSEVVGQKALNLPERARPHPCTLTFEIALDLRAEAFRCEWFGEWITATDQGAE
jgi:hypothetical protein